MVLLRIPQGDRVISAFCNNYSAIALNFAIHFTIQGVKLYSHWICYWYLIVSCLSIMHGTLCSWFPNAAVLDIQDAMAVYGNVVSLDSAVHEHHFTRFSFTGEPSLALVMAFTSKKHQNIGALLLIWINWCIRSDNSHNFGTQLISSQLIGQLALEV